MTDLDPCALQEHEFVKDGSSDVPVRPSSPQPPLPPPSSSVGWHRSEPAANPQTGPASSGSLDFQAVFISRISDLADKYWNGAKSLVKNERFKSEWHYYNYFYYSYCNCCYSYYYTFLLL